MTFTPSQTKKIFDFGTQEPLCTAKPQELQDQKKAGLGNFGHAGIKNNGGAGGIGIATHQYIYASLAHNDFDKLQVRALDYWTDEAEAIAEQMAGYTREAIGGMVYRPECKLSVSDPTIPDVQLTGRIDIVGGSEDEVLILEIKSKPEDAAMAAIQTQFYSAAYAIKAPDDKRPHRLAIVTPNGLQEKTTTPERSRALGDRILLTCEEQANHPVYRANAENCMRCSCLRCCAHGLNLAKQQALSDDPGLLIRAVELAAAWMDRAAAEMIQMQTTFTR